MNELKSGADTLFLLLGATMVLAMHAGFAFLELGTVRKKNQVNALVKILVDFAVSTIAYFFIGYTIAYGVQFFGNAATLAQHNGYDLVRSMRTRPWSQDTLIVALTGWGQEEDRRRSRDAGFDHHLAKPIGIDELLKLLA